MSQSHHVRVLRENVAKLKSEEAKAGARWFLAVVDHEPLPWPEDAALSTWTSELRAEENWQPAGKGTGTRNSPPVIAAALYAAGMLDRIGAAAHGMVNVIKGPNDDDLCALLKALAGSNNVDSAIREELSRVIPSICCDAAGVAPQPDLQDARRKIDEAIRKKAYEIAGLDPANKNYKADLQARSEELAHLKEARDALVPTKNPTTPDSDGLIKSLVERSCWDPCDPSQEPPAVAIIEGFPLDITDSCAPRCPPKTCCGSCSSCGCSTEDRNKQLAAKWDRWFRLYYDLSMSTWVDVWEGQIVWTQRLGTGAESRAKYSLWVISPESLVIQRARAVPAAQLF